MNLIKDFIKKRAKNTCDTNVIFIITEKLKPWVVINCLEKENYIITDRQAEEIAKTIIKQALSLNVLEKVLSNLRVI